MTMNDFPLGALVFTIAVKGFTKTFNKYVTDPSFL